MPRRLVGRPDTNLNELVLSLVASATLAEINDSKVIYPQKNGVYIRPLGALLVVTGAFTGLTDLRLSSYDVNGGSAVDVITVAQANLTNGAKWKDDHANMVLGAGWGVALTIGHGLQIRKTGGTAAGGTKVDLYLLFNKYTN